MNKLERIAWLKGNIYVLELIESGYTRIDLVSRLHDARKQLKKEEYK